MKNRIILHIDMDAFFPSVEERENLRFKGLPIVVGADPKRGMGRGVVSSASYSARKFGIKSGMPISKAYELCPTAIFLPVNIELYQRVSEEIMEIIKKYSPKWEIVSLDEAYLDLSYVFYDRKKCSIKEAWEEVKDIAQRVKKEILEEERLTSTVGIGPNKLIAKMAAEKAKPPHQFFWCGGKSNGLLIIKPNQVKSFLEPLDIEDLPGIGPKTAEKLRVTGINKIQELKRLSKLKLKNMFGKMGEATYERARGIDEEPVSPEEVIKSIGKEHTFEKDTRDPEIIFQTFEEIINNIYQELESNKFRFKTIEVTCRFKDFETHTKSKTLKNKTRDFKTLESESKKLLLRFLIENSKPVRLIGIRLNIAYPSDSEG